ncbi:uncharacterized protein LOC132254200 [Vitis vinifera]|uniref:uncharacterized protein LOC132254200 n=1 Tax=Vitis vinifera TaxID=29760 RepID=UPI00053FF6D1|nr:uncharacterized protein LOC132254200 [Vitis vinifera]
MKESETIKEYSERLLSIANRVRLLGSEFKDSRIVEKILVTLPERFEATLTTLENTKDLSKITLAELLNSLQVQEQRIAMRQEATVEEALPAKHEDGWRNKKKKNRKHQQANGEAAAHRSNKNKARSSKGKYPPCKHCDRTGHSPFKCWKRPDDKCNKCNHLGHEAIICKNQNQQQDADAQIANEDENDHLFVATCFSGSISSNSWLIVNGCTNHMTHDKELFKELKPTRIARVRIGHGGHIPAKGIGTVAIATHLGSSAKLIDEFKLDMMQVFEMTDLGLMTYFLGMEIKQ